MGLEVPKSADSPKGMKLFIEQERLKLLEAVPGAAENVKELVGEMRNLFRDDTNRNGIILPGQL